MSHNVLISDVKIKNLSALRAAVAELAKEGVKIALDETARTFRTYDGQPNKCDLAIRMSDERGDVGLVKGQDGTYTPVYDPYLFSKDSGIACPYTPGRGSDNRQAIGLLLQRYAVCTTEIEAAMQGHACTREQGKDGELLVRVHI